MNYTTQLSLKDFEDAVIIKYKIDSRIVINDNSLIRYKFINPFRIFLNKTKIENRLVGEKLKLALEESIDKQTIENIFSDNIEDDWYAYRIRTIIEKIKGKPSFNTRYMFYNV